MVPLPEQSSELMSDHDQSQEMDTTNEDTQHKVVVEEDEEEDPASGMDVAEDEDQLSHHQQEDEDEYNEAAEEHNDSNDHSHDEDQHESAPGLEQPAEESDGGNVSVSQEPSPAQSTETPASANPTTATTATTIPATPTPKPLIPSLKGTMSYVGGVIYCKGRWAMSDADHATPHLTSDFEFRLITAEEGNSNTFPINGLYQGWFAIKQPPPLKSLKVEDKEMTMKFYPKDDNNFDIEGQGHNQYGKFNLRGTLTKEGAAHIYREYYHINPSPVIIPPKKVERRVSIDNKKNLEVKIEAPASSPRETARIRKPSSIVKESQEVLVKTPKSQTPRDSLKTSISSASLPPAAELSRQSSVERTHRMNPAFKKCSELLKELSKLPQAIWFLEPVDPIKFGIPDYPKIIKNPMDFSTIRVNIEKGLYETIDEFAEHVRLVFRNAITFNTAKDSAVHVAAKDLGKRFEDKYRQLVIQLDPEAFQPAEQKPKTTSAKKLPPPSKPTREPSFSKPMKPAPGPRPYSLPPPASFVPSVAVDGSTQLILEMQRKMEMMAAELDRLRGEVQEQKIIQKVEETKEAAYNPLTLEEKKALVAQIYKLSPEKMEKALDIIREAIDPTDDAEVEIPLDSLDTYTLRKLQKFINENTEKKKRSISAPSLSRQSSSKNGEPSTKKPRKSKSSANNLMASGDDSFELFDDSEPLLLEENFDDIQHKTSGSSGAAGSNGYHVYSHHDHEEEDDDDDNKWDRAVV